MPEPFFKALTRNTALAAVLAVLFLFALPRQGEGGLGWDFLDAFTLAFCFSFIGYYVEVVLLMIPGIEIGGGRLIRIAGWFAGGLWCYVVGRYLWVLYGRNVADLPPLVSGGVFLVVLELVLHGLLNKKGVPNFYRPFVE